MPKPEPAAVYLSPEELVPWAANPRDNEAAVPRVARSIAFLGWGNPILARRETMMVIAGNTRLKAVPVLAEMWVEAKDDPDMAGRWHPSAIAIAEGGPVPVRLLDVTEEQAVQLALADNKIGEIAEWSDGLGDLLREHVDDGGETLALLGWDGDDLLDFGWDEDVLIQIGAHERKQGDGTPAEPPTPTQTGTFRIILGDCVEELAKLDPSSIDAIVTDPPYGLGFMGSKWDALPPGLPWAEECLRVLKPGGHIVAFGGQRTIHRLTCSLEDAGFEIRDLIGWMQYQGFPKSLDVSKAIDAAAGAEREVVGHKKLNPRDRVAYTPATASMLNGEAHIVGPQTITAPATDAAKQWDGWGTALKPCIEPATLARKPLEGTVAANVQKWGTGALNIDGCRYAYGDEAWPGPQERWDGRQRVVNGERSAYGKFEDDDKDRVAMPVHDLGRWPSNVYATPKASRSEREAGVGHIAPPGERFTTHPTVKPIALMRWLCRLVTPPGGTVLDTFTGSGTTGIAACAEGFDFIGIEREAEYVEIAKARITFGPPPPEADGPGALR